MTSEQLRQAIPEYLAGYLSPADTAQFEAQLSTNPDLRMELDDLRTTWEALGFLPRPQPSAAMRARFYQRLDDIQQGRMPAPGRGFAWWKPGLSGLARQLAIVLVLFCAGVYAGRLSMEKHQPSPDIAQLQGQVQTLRQTVALSLLDRQSPASRLEGVSWGSQVEHPDRDLLSALIATLEHDQNVNVRLAALDALEKFSNEPVVRQALVHALGNQDSPLVQIALIDALVHLREKDATGEFRKLSTEAGANSEVRQRAQWALQTLKF
jgi:HEAT repeat protein